jgi:pyrrolidone-carboxylate peptidase
VSSVRDFYSSLQGQSDIFVLHIGVDFCVSVVKLEAIAHNIADFTWGDADGLKLSNESISKDYPFKYEFRNPLNVQQLVSQLGDPVVFSEDAGSYICNYSYFHGLTHVGTDIRGCLFVHIPEFSKVDAETAVARVVLLCETILKLPQFQ